MSGVTLLDGGMGRALSELGVSLDAPLWSARAFLSRPDLIQKAHENFIRAGSQVITTNGYALTDYYLTMAGLMDQKEELLKASYALAHQARRVLGRRDVRIAASIPPLNESYRPDLVDERQMAVEYPQLIHSAAEAGADILLGETLSTVSEARSILANTGEQRIETWISFTVSGNGRLRSGESLAEAAGVCSEMGASAVLINCSTPHEIDAALDALAESLEGSGLRYGAYANRFTQVRPDFTLKGGLNPIDEGVSCPDYREMVLGWVRRGARIVGGCCGFGPEYIREIAESLSAI